MPKYFKRFLAYNKAKDILSKHILANNCFEHIAMYRKSNRVEENNISAE